MEAFIHYCRFLMQKEPALKYSLCTAAIAFPLSVAFTIASLALQCSYSLLNAPCPNTLPNNPHPCSDTLDNYYCGTQGPFQCMEFSSCQIQPGIGLCLGFLIVTWLSYLSFMVAVICWVVVQRRAGREWGEEYSQLRQGIEIGQRGG